MEQYGGLPAPRGRSTFAATYCCKYGYWTSPSVAWDLQIKADKVEATYRDGVLEVTVPKAEEAKAHEIPIKTAR